MLLQKIKKIHSVVVSTIQKVIINITLPIAYITFVGITSIFKNLSFKKEVNGWKAISDDINLESLKRQS